MFDNKNFAPECRSAHSPFDLLLEAHNMKYMLLIYHDEQVWNRHTEAERQQIYGEYRQLIQKLQSSGQYLAGDQLQPTTTASTVRIREGKQIVTDGPFAETREQIGGFFMIDARDLDEATNIAAQIPSARMGSIEIRPVVETAEPVSA
jgi:hypothetical protein